jgi:hypothetical protein
MVGAAPLVQRHGSNLDANAINFRNQLSQLAGEKLEK